jgi:hypothetical protein
MRRTWITVTGAGEQPKSLLLRASAIESLRVPSAGGVEIRMGSGALHYVEDDFEHVMAAVEGLTTAAPLIGGSPS